MFAINTKGIVMNCKHCNERSIIFFLKSLDIKQIPVPGGD